MKTKRFLCLILIALACGPGASADEPLREMAKTIGSVDSDDLSFSDGHGVRIGGAPLYVDVWAQAPGVKRKNESEWLRTRFAVSSLTNDEQSGAVVAEIDTSTWESRHASSPDDDTSGAGLVRLGMVKFEAGMGGGPVGTQWQGEMRLELELGGISASEMLRVTKNLELYIHGAMGIGLRVVDRNALALSYAMTGDMRAGVGIADRVYVGAKMKARAGGDSLRTTYGAEVRWRVNHEDTIGASVDHTEYAGQDVLATDPAGWTLNFGYFKRFE
ncbi:MAG: hypothetical protein HY074_06500 [Deltaproteobacteria bacterium]|nr:hypothetical protein [Deltaproteobacteria bacterium]